MTGAVYVGAGVFTMNGGKISGNETTSTGANLAGAVLVFGGTFTMNDGIITGNKAEITTQQGAGGVMVANNGRFTMNGGTVTENSGSYGDVVKVSQRYTTPSDISNVYLGGNAVIGTLTNFDASNSGTLASDMYKPYPIYITASWTGEIETLNLRGHHQNITGSGSVVAKWLNWKVVDGSPQAALTNEHIASIKSVYFMNFTYGSTPVEISAAGTGYQISTAAAPVTKGTLIAK